MPGQRLETAYGTIGSTRNHRRAARRTPLGTYSGCVVAAHGGEIDGLETLILQLARHPDLTASACKILDRGDEVMALLDAMAAWNAQLGLVQGKETGDDAGC